MTIQSYLFLRKLKKAQITENGTVYFNEEKMTMSVEHKANEPYVDIDISKYENSIKSIVDYLRGHNLVIAPAANHGLSYVKVTHEGWRATQVQIGKLIRFLTASVLVPIVVSAITALITIWISNIR